MYNMVHINIHVQTLKHILGHENFLRGEIKKKARERNTCCGGGCCDTALAAAAAVFATPYNDAAYIPKQCLHYTVWYTNLYVYMRRMYTLLTQCIHTLLNYRIRCKGFYYYYFVLSNVNNIIVLISFPCSRRVSTVYHSCSYRITYWF